MRLITPALLATSLLTACATPQTPLSADPIAVVAAGSLREAMTDIARAHEARTGQKLTLSFAASGLLRERIEKGEAAQVFASADMGHPQPNTPVHCDNATAVGIGNNTIKRQRSRSMEMRYFWVCTKSSIATSRYTGTLDWKICSITFPNTTMMHISSR